MNSTPHGMPEPQLTADPRRIRFPTGGTPQPAAWYRRGETVDDGRAAALMEDGDVTDVMVGGDFVAVGLDPKISWADRIDSIAARIDALFESDPTPPDARAGAAGGHGPRAEDLHLLDPDRLDHRSRLVASLDDDDPRARRGAIAMLGRCSEDAVRKAAIITGYHDPDPMVRKTAIDAAADLDDIAYRPLFEEAVDDPDPWIRWRAVGALHHIGPAPSHDRLILAAVDDDPQVRAAAEAALEDAG